MSCTWPEIWAATGPRHLLDMLIPLRDEHARWGDATLVPNTTGDIELVLRRFERRKLQLLVVEDPSQPSRRHGSPFLGRDVALGWLRLEAGDLARYALRTAALLRRQSQQAEEVVVLLGPREQRYLDLLDELERTAESLPAQHVLRWSAERIRREPLSRALRLGAAAVLYTGHGNAQGLFAYGGMHIEALAGSQEWTADQVNALLFLLTCKTGRADAFADRAVARGVAGTVLAAVNDPLHAGNRRLAHALVTALSCQPRQRMSDLLEKARAEGASLDDYAVIGDPATWATSAPGALVRGKQVFAPAADATLRRGGLPPDTEALACEL